MINDKKKEKEKESRKINAKHTCWLAVSLDSEKSGHIFNSTYRLDDINITNPMINSICHVSKPTVANQMVAEKERK